MSKVRVTGRRHGKSAYLAWRKYYESLRATQGVEYSVRQALQGIDAQAQLYCESGPMTKVWVAVCHGKRAVANTSVGADEAVLLD